MKAPHHFRMSQSANQTISHPRRLEFSATLLWKPHILQGVLQFCCAMYRFFGRFI